MHGKIMRLTITVGLLCMLVIASIVATSPSDWALETFVGLTSAEGDLLQVELRRHCCHGVAETRASFCDEFKVPEHDCIRLEELIMRAPQNHAKECHCTDAARDRSRYGHAKKLHTTSMRVMHAEENRTQWIKLAIHEGDTVVLDTRVDRLCEHLDLDSGVCTSVRRMLREQAIRQELQHHQQTLLEFTTDSQAVTHVLIAIDRMIGALLDANKRLHDELGQKAQAYATLHTRAQAQHHELERRVRELENELKRIQHQSPQPTHEPSVSMILTDVSPGPLTRRFAPGSIRIPRVHVSNFSYAQYLEYARSSTPVIFEGLADLPGSPGLPRWTLHSLHTNCGDSVVTLKRPVGEASGENGRSSMMWAGIEPMTKVPLRHFLRDLMAATTMKWPYGYTDLYLHDASIRSFCPQLLNEFTFPRYFTDDRLQVDLSSRQNNYWPSLFIGGTSTASALHVDWASTAAWMGLLAGRKHWAIAKPSAKAALFELFPTDLAQSQGRFKASLLRGRLSSLLQPGEVYEDILEAGQVLFIPADCPHQVQNLDTTIAVAANFVDMGNLEAFRRQIQIMKDSTTGDQSRRHARTLRRLDTWAVAVNASNAEPMDLSYAQFKKRHRSPDMIRAP